MEHFKYLGTTLTDQNPVHEEINPLNAELSPICHLLALLGAHHIFHVSGLRVKSRLNLGNACCHSVQNRLSSVCYPKIYRLKYLVKDAEL